MPLKGVKQKPMALDRKTQILLAIISAAVTLIVAYWQFGPKPAPAEDEQPSYQGRVIDSVSQRTIEGAKVSVDAKGVSPIDHTDSNGIFHVKLSGAPNPVRVRVEAAGYAPFSQYVPLSEDGFEEIRLVPASAPQQSTPTEQPKTPANKSSGNSATLRRSMRRRPKEDGNLNLLDQRLQVLENINKRPPPTPR